MAQPATTAYEASYGQRRIWNRNRQDPLTRRYNVHSTFRLRGRLDVSALHRAFAEIVHRHESLRTVFAERAGRLQQVVLLEGDVAFRSCAARSEDREAEIHMRSEEEAAAIFDLANGPLAHFRLVELADDDFVLLLTLHHAIYDGWSGGVLYRELSVLYDRYANGIDRVLAPPSQYSSYSVHHNAWLGSDSARQEAAFWRQQLHGASPTLDLETAFPVAPSSDDTKCLFTLPKPVGRALLDRSREFRTTPYMLMLAAFKIVLHHHTGQRDICIASSVACRRRQEWEGVIGLVRNGVLVRTIVKAADSGAVLLRRVRDSAADSFDHQDLPLDEVLSAVASDVTTWRDRLVWFNVGGRYRPTIPGIQVDRWQATPRCSGRYLCFWLFPTDMDPVRSSTAWAGEVEYNRLFLQRETAMTLISDFTRVLCRLCEAPHKTVAEIGDTAWSTT